MYAYVCVVKSHFIVNASLHLSVDLRAQARLVAQEEDQQHMFFFFSHLFPSAASVLIFFVVKKVRAYTAVHDIA